MPALPSLISVILTSALLPAVVIANPYVVDYAKKVSYYGITSSPGIETFLGIPYGQDTSGENRFAPPQAFSPVLGYVYNATVAGPSCPQQVGGGFLYQEDVTYQSENCLNLQLARPANICNGTKLPVMVYIYGGKFVISMIHAALTRI
jgi:carboxylesterase type B